MKYERNSNQISLHFISRNLFSFPSHSHLIQSSFRRRISSEFRELVPEFELQDFAESLDFEVDLEKSNSAVGLQIWSTICLAFCIGSGKFSCILRRHERVTDRILDRDSGEADAGRVIFLDRILVGVIGNCC